MAEQRCRFDDHTEAEHTPTHYWLPTDHAFEPRPVPVPQPDSPAQALLREIFEAQPDSPAPTAPRMLWCDDCGQEHEEFAAPPAVPVERPQPAPSAGLSPVRLSEIRARAEKATPGPWRYWNDGWVGKVTPEGQVSPPIVAPAAQAWKGDGPCPHDGSKASADAEFIAAARSDVPDLLAEVDRLQEARRVDSEAAQQGYYAEAKEHQRLLAVVARLTGERDAARAALVEIKNVLGPDHLCNCDSDGCEACEGLRVEAGEALHTARIALGLAPDPVVPKEIG